MVKPEDGIYDLPSPTENETTELRHVGMNGLHPDSQYASGDIHVSLDSSAPCWNDPDRGIRLKVDWLFLFSKEQSGSAGEENR
jgi:hypothetical protein